MSQRPKCSSTKVEKPKKNLKNRLTNEKFFHLSTYFSIFLWLFDLRARALRSLETLDFIDFWLSFAILLLNYFLKNELIFL